MIGFEMNSLDLAAPGDVINLIVSKRAYPYQREEGETSTRLQGRVVFADSIGVCLETTGSPITPSFKREHDYMAKPTDGILFPWGAIKRLEFRMSSGEYEANWKWHNAKEEVFADAHDGKYAADDRQYREWEREQNSADLARRTRAALAKAATE